jgi:hypothetical protein
MFANKPSMARRWALETNQSKLPETAKHKRARKHRLT